MTLDYKSFETGVYHIYRLNRYDNPDKIGSIVIFLDDEANKVGYFRPMDKLLNKKELEEIVQQIKVYESE